MLSEEEEDQVINQGIADYIRFLNAQRLKTLADTLEKILTDSQDAENDLNNRLADALGQLAKADDRIGEYIASDRGGVKGIHGFIAEQAEVGISNAKNAFQGLNPIVKAFDNNGPVDLLIGDKAVQAKFYQNLPEELKTALNPEYQNMDMLFPKDHVAIYKAIMNGENHVDYDGSPLSQKKITKIRELIKEAEQKRKAPFSQWMRPAQTDYDQVQKNTYEKTFASQKESFLKQKREESKEIRNQADQGRTFAAEKATPNLGEAAKAGAVGAFVQGGFDFLSFAYKKHKEGKELWQYDSEDWKACGLSTARGAFKGGFSGFAIYGLTNFCGLAAPSAGALVSGTYGLLNSVIEYRAGRLDDDGFIQAVIFNSVDSVGAALGAAVGQALIPIPVLGATIGSLIATNALSMGKDFLSKQEKEALAAYQQKIDQYVQGLDQEYQGRFQEIHARYLKLGDLQTYSFDLGVNVRLRLVASIELAEMAGVPEERILHTDSEIDDFFLN